MRWRFQNVFDVAIPNIDQIWKKTKTNWNEKGFKNTLDFNVRTPLIIIWPMTSTTPTSSFKNNEEHQKQEHTQSEECLKQEHINWRTPKIRAQKMKKT
jgi:hypothetical protein